MVYAGLWYEPLRADLDAYMDSVNEHVTGEVTVRLFKGRAQVVTRRSPNALYDEALAGFGESGGLFSQHASPGFIELWTLQSRMGHRMRNRAHPAEPDASGLENRAHPAEPDASGRANRGTGPA